MIFIKRLIFLAFLAISCQGSGQLNLKGSINNELEEVSAAEMDKSGNLVWVIEDAGNENNLFALNLDGSIAKTIAIKNAKNEDWEDLTSDAEGNIYIGDFGNNGRKREDFEIYKVNRADLNKPVVNAEVIEFSLPKGKNPEDFESFFLFDNHFYIFSKEKKNFVVLKVKNAIGKQETELHEKHNLKGKHNKITSADISEDGKTVVLLNHDKLWKITDFKGDDFFEGTISELSFYHNTQKEGVGFVNDNTVVITDERNADEGGNIYTFSLDQTSN